VFEDFVRHFEFVTRLAKAAGMCAVGIATVVRCYDRLDSMNGLYALVLCIFFALFMVGIAIHTINEEQVQ
jgi:hypothetical protein